MRTRAIAASKLEVHFFFTFFVLFTFLAPSEPYECKCLSVGLSVCRSVAKYVDKFNFLQILIFFSKIFFLNC